MRAIVRSCLTLAFLLSLASVATGQITATIEPPRPTSADFVGVRLQGSICRSFAATPVTIQGAAIRIAFVTTSPCFSVPRAINVLAPIGQLPTGRYTVTVLASQIDYVDFSFPLAIADGGPIEPIPAMSHFGLLMLTLAVGALALLGFGRMPERASGSDGVRSSKLVLAAILIGATAIASVPTSAFGAREAPTLVLLIDPNVDPPWPTISSPQQLDSATIQVCCRSSAVRPTLGSFRATGSRGRSRSNCILIPPYTQCRGTSL